MIKKIYNILPALTLLSISLPSSPAGATADILGIQGIKSGTMGGAVIAGGSDHWAPWYNVANINLEHARFKAGFDIAGVYNAATYVRRDDGQLTASNTLLPKMAGGIVVAAGRHVSLGLHYYSPYNSTQDYSPAHIAGRSVVSDKGSQAHILQLSTSIRLGGKVTLGMGIQNHFVKYKQQLLVNTTSDGGNLYDRTGERQIALNALDPLNISGTIGLTVNPNDNWAVATSLQLPVTARFAGTATMPDREGSFTLTDKLPLTVRLGLRYTQPQKWALELSAIYDHTAIRQTLDWNFSGLEFPQTALTLPLNRKDRFSIHFGGQYFVTKAVELRGGIMYQSNSVSAENLTTYNFDSHKVALGLGVAYNFSWGMNITIGYNYYYFVPRNEAASQIAPLNIRDGQSGAKIGNGTYSYALHNFGLGIEYRL